MVFKIYIFNYYRDSNFGKLLFETRAMLHCHNAYIRHPSIVDILHNKENL